MVGKAHDLPGFEHPLHRIHRGLARLGMHDSEHLGQRTPERLRHGPAGQALGHGIHAGDGS